MRVFLTGSPATGKSTLCQLLANRDGRVRVFAFGEAMENHLTSAGKPARLKDMRQGTMPLVSSDDIEAVCTRMLDWLSLHELGSISVIDSHQVTIESHGVSVRPFESSILSKMQIDQIWVTVSTPAEVISRMSSDGKGRKIPSEFLAAAHDGAQMALAVRYSAVWDCPVHVIENCSSKADLLESARNLLV